MSGEDKTRHIEEGKKNEILSAVIELGKIDGENLKNKEEVKEKCRCGNCKKLFDDCVNEKIIQCDGKCEQFFHIKCAYLNDNEYKTLKKIQNVFWFCNKCYKESKKSIPMTVNNKINEKIGEINDNIEKLRQDLRCTTCINEEDIDKSNSMCSENQKERLQEKRRKYGQTNNEECDIGNDENARQYRNISSRSIKKKENNVIIIKPIDINEKSEKTENVLKQAVDPKKLQIGIAQIKKLKEGGLAVQCDKTEHVLNLIKEAKEKMGQEYEIRLPKERKSSDKMLIIGVLNSQINDDREKWEQEICEQNGIGKINIIHKKVNYYKTTVNLIIEVDKETMAMLHTEGKIKMGWQMCKIVEYLQIMRCYNCNEYGHIALHCKGETACGYCAGHHSYNECVGDFAECVNCIRANERYKMRYNTRHEVNDKKCECYKRIQDILKRKSEEEWNNCA